jgi:hypothetical protein
MSYLDSFPSSGPVIRIEVEGMKHTILKHLTAYDGILQEHVEKAIDSFPWEQELRTKTHAAVKKLLDSAVDQAVYQLRPSLEQSLAVAVKKVLKDYKP